MTRRWFTVLGLSLAVTAWHAGAADAPPPAREREVLGHVTEVAGWYQHVRSLEQGQPTPGEVLIRDATGRTSRQVLDVTIEFARAEATRAEATRAEATRAEVATTETPRSSPTSGDGPAASPTTGPATHPATASSQPGRGRRIEQVAATVAQRVVQLRADLDAVERQVAAAAPGAVPADLAARRDRLASELNLATVRRDVLQRLLTLRGGSDGEAEGSLLDKIDAIQRSIPAAPGQDSSAAAAVATASASAASASASSEPTGVFGLVSRMSQLSGRMRELKDLAEQAASLRQTGDALRGPIRTELMAAVRQVDAVDNAGGTTGTAGGGDPEAERRELDALAARFRQLSDAAMPLSRQAVLLDQARASLLEWRALLGRQYRDAALALLLRVGLTAAVIGAVFVVSVLWRRATFRYVHDPRRRRQFMLLRRLVIGCAIGVIAAFNFVSELGSLATFVGILTAGIAVSLQTLILSGVAYFFFVGRFGVRVGDRVTVAGVTGEVLDTGLFRLHLLELGGARRFEPTGRVVVFANSVLFQPAGFFKQAPGADYVWHEVSLTLSPESDHRVAEARLLGAVQSVFDEYRDDIDRQHAAARRSGAAPAAPPRPAGRLRFVDQGLEFTLRYPVELTRASEVEDRITRALLAAIEQEPKLRLVSSGTPVIQPAGQPA